MTHEEAMDARINQAMVANVENSTQDPDHTYVGIWKRYKDFVTSQHMRSEGGKYITRRSIDLYFSEEVAAMTCTPQSASRIKYALQWYASNVEYIFEGFLVDSTAVQHALANQVKTYKEYLKTRVFDPHEKLPTNVLSKKDCDEVMVYILTNRKKDWKDLALSWTMGSSCFTRLASYKALKFMDLCLHKVHGPEDENGD